MTLQHRKEASPSSSLYRASSTSGNRSLVAVAFTFAFPSASTGRHPSTSFLKSEHLTGRHPPSQNSNTRVRQRVRGELQNLRSPERRQEASKTAEKTKPKNEKKNKDACYEIEVALSGQFLFDRRGSSAENPPNNVHFCHALRRINRPWCWFFIG